MRRYRPLAVWREVPFQIWRPCFLQEGVPNHASFGVISVKLYGSFCLLTSDKLLFASAFQRSWKCRFPSCTERCVYPNFQEVMQKLKASQSVPLCHFDVLAFTVARALLARECSWLDILSCHTLLTLDVICWLPSVIFWLVFFLVSSDFFSRV